MLNSIQNQSQNFLNTGKNNQKAKLSIFYINDMHGNIDNMAGMIAAADKFDKQTLNNGSDAIKISAGDNFSGGDEKKNKLVVDLLSRMGIEFSAVGNHEFDSTISEFYKFINPDKTKFLAANAKTPINSEFYNNVQKSSVIEVNGHKYGIVGLLPFDLETVTGGNEEKTEGIKAESIENSIKIVNEETKKLAEQGVDKIILVSHIGNDNDKKIAPMLHGVDVIVGGHSHTEVKGINGGENLLSNADGKPVLIVQTGENAKNIGVLNVEFDENGVPVKAENNLVKTSQEKSPVIDYMKDVYMGKSPVIGAIKEADPLPQNRRITPCAWTNFLCDAMRSETGVDIAFVNASNTRKVPKNGELTQRDVTESTPLKNTLLVKKMTEKEVVRAIKDALQMTFSNKTGEPGILHTSGLSYKADTKGNLHELNFVDKNGNKTPIDINNPTDKVYSVCYDSFLAKGTEYPVFVPEKMTYTQIDAQFNYDKDKLLIDAINRNPSKDNLVVKDDKRTVITDENGQELSALRNDEQKTENPAQTNTFIQSNLKFSPLLQLRINSMGAMSGYKATP